MKRVLFAVFFISLIQTASLMSQVKRSHEKTFTEKAQEKLGETATGLYQGAVSAKNVMAEKASGIRGAIAEKGSTVSNKFKSAWLGVKNRVVPRWEQAKGAWYDYKKKALNKFFPVSQQRKELARLEDEQAELWRKKTNIETMELLRDEVITKGDSLDQVPDAMKRQLADVLEYYNKEGFVSENNSADRTIFENYIKLLRGEPLSEGSSLESYEKAAVSKLNKYINKITYFMYHDSLDEPGRDLSRWIGNNQEESQSNIELLNQKIKANEKRIEELYRSLDKLGDKRLQTYSPIPLPEEKIIQEEDVVVASQQEEQPRQDDDILMNVQERLKKGEFVLEVEPEQRQRRIRDLREYNDPTFQESVERLNRLYEQQKIVAIDIQVLRKVLADMQQQDLALKDEASREKFEKGIRMLEERLVLWNTVKDEIAQQESAINKRVEQFKRIKELERNLTSASLLRYTFEGSEVPEGLQNRRREIEMLENEVEGFEYWLENTQNADKRLALNNQKKATKLQLQEKRKKLLDDLEKSILTIEKQLKKSDYSDVKEAYTKLNTWTEVGSNEKWGVILYLKQRFPNYEIEKEIQDNEIRAVLSQQLQKDIAILEGKEADLKVQIALFDELKALI